MRWDSEAVDEARLLQGRLRSPNLATAMHNAVRLLLDLCREQYKGFELHAVKGRKRVRLRIPTSPYRAEMSR
jgi:hypothetical protein